MTRFGKLTLAAFLALAAMTGVLAGSAHAAQFASSPIVKAAPQSGSLKTPVDGSGLTASASARRKSCPPGGCMPPPPPTCPPGGCMCPPGGCMDPPPLR